MSGTNSKAPCTKEGYNFFSITLANLEEFLVISIFHDLFFKKHPKTAISSSSRNEKNKITFLHFQL
jgi:hypothetical protein